LFKNKNLFQAKFIRTDRKTGEHVFDVTYVPSLSDDTRHRIWVDADKKVVTKREWYTQLGGYLLATFYYEGHEKQNGVWFPTTLSVKNADDKQAGVTHYKNLKVNAGLDEDIFSVR
jgi:outer membrane lipoprotein-sorting protein